MVKVMATGTFDILHLGHIYYLKEAKKLGDKLVVVVATDTTVKRLKHEPVNPAEIRLKLIKELKIVDEAYIGHEDDIYEIVEEIKPDIIALGFDQIHDKIKIEKELKKRKINVKIVRLEKYNGGSDLEGTRKIISKIISAYEFQKNIERIEGNEEDRHC
ncbi:MAG: FAD synthase [Thermoplasmatales archaeon SG8-52-3]|nr:MAG: FAD synthase [Thermoplasmatales archaeon SG8-52-3]